MRRKKTLILLTVFALFIFAFAGCGNTDTGEAESDATGITLTDMEGREITLEEDVDEIVVIGSALRLYTYIAGTEYLVGVEKAQQTADSGRPYIMDNPELSDLAIGGEGHPNDPDPELLIAADPDVIISGDIMDTASLEELQEKTGIPVVIVTAGDNAVFDEDMYEAMRIIGQITGKDERAEEVIAYMEDCKQELSDLTADIADEDKPSIYVGALSFKGAHGIESTSGQTPLLTAINANNVADEVGTAGSIMIDKEQLLVWDPDIIVVDAGGLSIVEEDYAANPDLYDSLTAVKEGNVYLQLPYVNYYNNVETAMADIYYAGSILYPEAFASIDPIEKADEIYTFLLGEPLYEQMAELYGGYKQITLGE